MASGRPILAGVPDGDARDFLQQCGTALVCRPDDVQGMMKNIERVYQAWKCGKTDLRSNVAFVNQFERRTLTAALAQALRDELGLAASDAVLSTAGEPPSVTTLLGDSSEK